MSRVVIIGYGSIGARHARLLVDAGADVACVTRNAACPHPLFSTIREAVAVFSPSHVLISNATSRHGPALRELAATGWRGPVLVEKPLFDSAEPVEPPAGLAVSVAFNLRFHPLVKQLKSRLSAFTLHAATFYVGQYLPDWRPQDDYRRSYSASRQAGGGVLRDLSHELDLAAHLCGAVQKVIGLGGRFSGLEIDSDDVFHLMATAQRCPVVSIAMNYLDRPARRVLTVTGSDVTAVLDFIAGTLHINDDVIMEKPDRDATYRSQLNDFLARREDTLCSFAQGRQVDGVIAAIERSVAAGSWISLS